MITDIMAYTAKERRKVYDELLKKFGADKQMGKAVEELLELATALVQLKNGKQPDVITEIADVFIMVEQLSIIFGEKDIQELINYKIERTKNRLL